MPIKVTYREARRLFAHGWEVGLCNADDELVVIIYHNGGSCRWAVRWFRHNVQIFDAVSFFARKRV